MQWKVKQEKIKQKQKRKKKSQKVIQENKLIAWVNAGGLEINKAALKYLLKKTFFIINRGSWKRGIDLIQRCPYRTLFL